jgi:hypothetical protein
MKLDLLALALLIENDPYLPQHSGQGTCANSSREKGGSKCKNAAVEGHIYCDPCRLALGGYHRYNRPAKRIHIHTDTDTQEL